MKINLSKILQQIYNAEIPVRIEAMYDMGWSWTLVDETVFPRIFHDMRIEGVALENMLSRDVNPVLEKDWIAKGLSMTFESAVKDLAEAIVKNLPESQFSKWYRGIN